MPLISDRSQKFGMSTTKCPWSRDSSRPVSPPVELRAEFDRGVDVVLDFIWGEPASRVIAAATKNRGSRLGEPRVRYVQLGTVAGDEISLRGDAFRGSGLELMGSGIGSVAIRELLAGARELLTETNKAGFDAPVTTLPLTAVADAWAGPSDVRYILSPAGHTH